MESLVGATTTTTTSEASAASLSDSPSGSGDASLLDIVDYNESVMRSKCASFSHGQGSPSEQVWSSSFPDLTTGQRVQVAQTQATYSTVTGTHGCPDEDEDEDEEPMFKVPSVRSSRFAPTLRLRTGSSWVARRTNNTVTSTATSRTRKTPRTPAAASTFTTSRAYDAAANTTAATATTTVLANPHCLVALMEGRGAAKGEVGMAAIRLDDPTLVLCQLADSRTSYSRTLAKLAMLNPVEIVIPLEGGAEFRGGAGGGGGNVASKLYGDAESCCPAAIVQQVQRRYFNEAKGMQVLRHLCAPEYAAVEVHLQHKFYSLAAANALIKYTEHIQNVYFAPRSLRVEFQASADSVLVDADTARNVELLTPSLASNRRRGSTGAAGGAKSSLMGVLNHCHTPGGVRHLRAGLFQPPTRRDVIELRLDAVEELIAKPGIFHALQSLVSRYCDIDKLLSLCVVIPRQENAFVQEQRLNNVIGLRHALELVEPLHTALGCAEADLLSDMYSTLRDPSYAEVFQKVSEVLSDSARIQKGSSGMKLQRCFAIKAGVNGVLDVARRAYCEIVDDIEETVAALSEEHGVSMRVAFSSGRGYYVQIPPQGGARRRAGGGSVTRAWLTVRDLPTSFLRPQQSKSGAMSFTTEAIVQTDQRAREVLREISYMSNEVVQALLGEVRGRIGCLYKLSEVIASLDVALALAEVSMSRGYVRPTFGPHTAILEARHPFLHETESRSVEVVANDVVATCESSFHVLTGANMSGKSTYLKMVILLQVMAQVGCYVPASKATFRLADCLFSRLGTGDSLECRASTFELEMKEMAYIVSGLAMHQRSNGSSDGDGDAHTRPSSSLVVIDELGRGTSPAEGVALCWAIAEEIIATNGAAFCFLATHFTLIKRMANTFPTVKNHYFVTQTRVDSETGQPIGLVHTHKLKSGDGDADETPQSPEGQPESSSDMSGRSPDCYGIHLAAATSLPREVVERARQLAGSLAGRVGRGEEEPVDGDDGGGDDHQEEEDVRRLNYVRLFNRLRATARDESQQGPDLAAYLKALRAKFVEEEAEEEMEQDP